MGVMNLGIFFVLSFLSVNAFCEKNYHVLMLETKADFDECIKAENLVVVEFYTAWCGPCKRIEHTIERMSTQYDKVTFYKVNTDENSEVAESESISAMPTFKFYKDGKQVAEVNSADENEIKDVIEKYM